MCLRTHKKKADYLHIVHVKMKLCKYKVRLTLHIFVYKYIKQNESYTL